MPSLATLLRAARDDLPVTMRHERWMTANPNPVYSPSALELARTQLSSERPHWGTGPMFSASGATQCPRRRVLRYLRFPEVGSIDSTLANIFHTGSFLHLKWQMAGLTEGWLLEAEVALQNDDLHVRGMIDGRLYDGSGFEFKTINSFGFRKVMDKGPKEDHIDQVHVYMLMDDTFDSFSVVYENKENGEWREFRVHRNPEVIDRVTQALTRLNDAVSNQEFPPMLRDCKNSEGREFRQCPFRESCPKAVWPA